MHWRYTSNQVRIGPIDGSVVIPVLAILIWPLKNHWTFGVLWKLAIVMAIVLGIAGRFGSTPGVFMLLMRTKFAQLLGGGMRPVHRAFQERKTRKAR